MALINQYTTALESAEKGEISNILNLMCERKTSHGVADYIGFAIDNIDNAIDRIDTQIKLMQEIKGRAKQQIETIKIGVAQWLNENGVEKLQGDIISSITVFDKAVTQEVIIDSESDIDVSYFKLFPDKTAIKKAINDGIEVIGAHIEVTHNEQSVKVNRKKVKVVDELGF